MSPFIRAHSRTRHASASAATRRMWAVDAGEPISSSGLATNMTRASGRPTVSRSAASAYSPARRPLFMSVTPGPVAIPRSSMANGRSAAVPGSNTVSMCPIASSVGPVGSLPASSPMTVSPSPRSFWWTVTLAPSDSSRARTQRPTSSTPSFVYEPQSRLTSRSRSARYAGRARSTAARIASSSAAATAGSVVGVMSAIYRTTGRHRPERPSRPRSPRVSSPDRATRRDPPVRGPQRLPARAGGQGRGRRGPRACVAWLADTDRRRARPPWPGRSRA